LSDIHKRFVKFNVENKTKLFNYIEKLSIVLNILWLRRIIDQFRFFDQFLIDVLFNIHQSILCSLSNHLRKVVNSQVKIITRRLKNELIDAMIKWKKKHCRNDIDFKNEHQQLIYNDSQNANIEHLFSFENSIENEIVIVHRTRKYEKWMNNSAKESILWITENQFFVWITFEWHLLCR
jgi:hypothetical protein